MGRKVYDVKGALAKKFSDKVLKAIFLEKNIELLINGLQLYI
jgi:hypothetical protein